MLKKTDILFKNYLLYRDYFHKNFKNVEEVKKYIIEKNHMDAAFHYLEDFGPDNEIINHLINTMSKEDFLSFEKLSDIVGLETLQKILGIDNVLDKIISFNNFDLIVRCAEKFELIHDFYSVQILETAIINSDNAMGIYRFATKIQSSNKENFISAFTKLEDANHIRKLAESFPNLAEKLTFEILATNNISEIIKFLLNVQGGPVGVIIKYLNLDQKGKLILISDLLTKDIIKFHFYADAIINNKDLSVQDDKYIQYCQSCDKSLEQILMQDLQLKNHVRVKTK